MSVWTEVEAQFGAEPLVAWDRDMADESWSPSFCTRISDGSPRLWADCPTCIAYRSFEISLSVRQLRARCRCRYWTGLRWARRIEAQDDEAKTLDEEREIGAASE
jgi:hypothetical protein